MNYKNIKKTLVASTVLGLGVGMAGSALAEEHTNDAADIVVTARRTEERLQDVPVSVTVFNQTQLNDRNITTPADLTAFTPSLSANVRFGNDAATFSLRGFAQEQRTSASVATYFGEVVAPRGLGGASTTAGDGAGPGSLFDLQNIQVLNGPQGTLFGRNTTGGAVLLVPQKPKDEFGGYGEVSFGDYGLERYQGVLNVAFSPDARLRIGMDRQSRDGYLDNAPSIGPDHFNEVNYEAYRASFVADLAPNLENYTIAYYTHSLTSGTLSRALACGTLVGPTITTAIACSDGNLDPVTHRNNQDFYTVRNTIPDAQFSLNVWQAQNITTWDVNDNFTVKNIASYGEYQSYTRGDVYGSFFSRLAGTSDTNPAWFAASGLSSNLDTSSTRTYSEELQFQGRALDNRLNWQAGLYYEETDPQKITGSVSQTFGRCLNRPTGNPFTWSSCYGILGSGAPTESAGELHFQTQALYFQGDYAITDRLKATLGYRYTWDRTDGDNIQVRFTTSSATNGSVIGKTCSVAGASPPATTTGNLEECIATDHNNTEAPTWVLGLDYQMTDNDMVYAKYSRGYRQGGINLFAPVSGGLNFRPFKAEQLDAYEIGTKLGFDGPVPGILNIAVYYNDLTDAQLQTGFVLPTPTTAILSGDVTTYGAEIAANFKVTSDFDLALAYGYTHTNVDRAPDLQGLTPTTVYHTGQALPNVPENKVTVSATYHLPTPESIGAIDLGATWSWVDRALLTPDNPAEFRYLNSYELLNLNLNWKHMFGSSVDGSIFVTNALDEEYNSYESGTLTALNYEVATAGPPRMIGARLRYSFGGEAN